MRYLIAVVLILAATVAFAGPAKAEAKAEAAEIVSSVVTTGIALNTHTSWTPNLTASVRVIGEGDWDWRLYLDGYLPLTFETAGAGVSLAPPAETPILSDILGALQVDRGGIAAVYDFDADDWTIGAVGIVEF